MIVAISGKSGSGKSKLSLELSKRLNYKRIDVDDYARVIRDKHKDEIIQLVGNRDFIISGKIDSKLLGKLLFEDKALMKKYNEFIYSFLEDEINKELEKAENGIIDSLFLPIMDVFKLCDYKILLECNDDIRYKRLMLRDSIDLIYIKQRDKFSLEYKHEDFDLIINSDSSFDVNEIINKIKKLSD